MNVNQKFVFKFLNATTGEAETGEVDSIKGESEAYARAREKIIERKNLSIREFERDWVLDRKQASLGVKDTSELTKESIREGIEYIEGVDSVTEVEAARYQWKFYIVTDPVIKEDYILDQIKELFSEIDNKSEERDILIVLNPPFVSR